MGRVFGHFDPWQIYVITGYPDFEYCYGRQADKKRKLYNGMIPCTLYQYYKPAQARAPQAPGRKPQKRDFTKKK